MSNCNNLVFLTQKTCLVCEPGRVFKNGVCVACEAGEGCAVCDWRKTNECLICADGYHQKAFKGSCTKSTLIPFDEVPENQSQIGLWRILSLSLVAFLF